jgi:hypothetical protein
MFLRNEPKPRENLPTGLAKEYSDIRRQFDGDVFKLFWAAFEGREEDYLQQRTNASESFAGLMLIMDRILHFAMTGDNIKTVADSYDDF